MRCKVVLSFKDQTNKQLHFNVVYSDGEENKNFFKYTPSGQMTFNVHNETVFNSMQQGEKYYVDFSPAGV